MTDQSGFHVYDTTLRDGAQQEGLNLSVADKLPIARHLDELGVGFIEGGWPGAIPKDTEFFRRAPTELTSSTRRSRRSARPAGPASRPPTTRWSPALVDSRRPVVTLVAKSTTGTSSWRCARRSQENLAMIRDTVSPPARRGPTGLPRRRALLRRLPRRPRLRARGAADGGRGRRRGRRAVRHQRRHAAGASWRTSSHDVRAASTGAARHPLPQRHRLRGGQLARRRRRRRDPRAGHRSTATASAPATPTCSPSSPTSSSSAAARVLPEGRLARRHPHRARDQRDHERAAVLAAAVRRRQRLRAQGGAARQRHQGRPEPLPAHRPASASATTCGCSSPTWPAARRSSSRAASSASTWRATASWSPG